MSDPDPVLEQLQEVRHRFGLLVADIRRDLHRYCARMTGSVIEGEDIVQDTLARAFYELSEMREPRSLRAWLFRMAHNRALDYTRSYGRRMSEPLDEQPTMHLVEEDDPDKALMRKQAVETAITRFLELPPIQRSCVILMDVLDHSLAEIAGMLGVSVLAVKAALHRGRTRLHALSTQPQGRAAHPHSATVQRYSDLFNARDWEGVRAMLVEDVRLDVVDRTHRVGRDEVGIYFGNYEKLRDWYVAPAQFDNREGLAVLRNGQVSYFIELTVRDDRIAGIRDFYHVPYVFEDVRALLASSAGLPQQP